MSRERVREILNQSITPEFLEAKLREGWKPVAIEWERESVAEGEVGVEVPYGLEVSSDGRLLKTHDGEMDCLRAILSQIVQDRPMSEVADELNRRGFRRRDGSVWTQTSVFSLLPRVIEVAPTIYDSEAWQAERPKLRSVGR